jgi:hypothetical protein
MSDMKLALTPQETEFVEALDALRLSLGLGMGRFARSMGGMSIDTIKSLLYRRRRPTHTMVAYVDQMFRNHLRDHPNYSERTLMERVIAAASAMTG